VMSPAVAVWWGWVVTDNEPSKESTHFGDEYAPCRMLACDFHRESYRQFTSSVRRVR
jgi:hypothetical protein